MYKMTFQGALKIITGTPQETMTKSRREESTCTTAAPAPADITPKISNACISCFSQAGKKTVLDINVHQRLEQI